MVDIPQFYFDTLPLHPPPKRLETLTSYLIRLAEENGFQSLPVRYFLFQALQISQGVASKDHLPTSFGNLPRVACCSEALLKQSTFYHVGQKFGRPATPNTLSRSIAPHLRYCPMCLADPENAFRSLAWRFLVLQGCNQHGCRLLSECTHCDQPIPVFATPIHMRICPTCGGDLGTCRIEPLSEQEQEKVSTVSGDVEFLLSPQPWESTVVDIARRLGQQFTHLRLLKQLKMSEVSDQMGITWGSLESLESGLEYGRIISFHVYFKYADYLKVTLREVFDGVIQSLEEDIQPRPGKRRTWPSEAEVIQQVQEAIAHLRSLDRTISLSAISELIHMDQAYWRRYKQVQAILEQVARETHAEQKQKIEQRHDELFETVQHTVRQLEELGEMVTLNVVAQRMGKTKECLQSHADIMALIKQSCNFYFSYKMAQGQQDEEIVRRVEFAIKELEANGQPISQAAIARSMGVHLTTLKRKLQAKELLARPAIKERRRQQREDALILQVESAIEQLRALGKPITLGAIAIIVRVSRVSLRAYPRVEALIEQSIKPNKNYKQRTIQEENDVLERVEAAIQELRRCNQQVTQVAVCKAVGMGKRPLRMYPRVCALLDECIDEGYCERKRAGLVRSNEMVLKVKQAIHELETQGELATQLAIARMLGMPAQNLMSYPMVRTLLSQYEPPEHLLSRREEKLLEEIEAAIQQLKAHGQSFSLRKLCKLTGHAKETLKNCPKVKAMLQHYSECERNLHMTRKQRREEEALREVEAVIGQLEACGQPISTRAIANKLGKHPASLYYYPKVATLLQHEVKDKMRKERLRQRQIREEELAQKVLEVGEQLQMSGQRISIRAIAERLQFYPHAFGSYPEVVREALKQILPKAKWRETGE